MGFRPWRFDALRPKAPGLQWFRVVGGASELLRAKLARVFGVWAGDVMLTFDVGVWSFVGFRV